MACQDQTIALMDIDVTEVHTDNNVSVHRIKMRWAHDPVSRSKLPFTVWLLTEAYLVFTALSINNTYSHTCFHLLARPL